MSKREAFIVSLEMPDDVTTAGMADYIQSAVCSMRGSLEPINPLFALDASSIKTVRLTPNRAARIGIKSPS